jgi:hypothetical protein
VYLFGGKTITSPGSNAAYAYAATNQLFSLETNTSDKIPKWTRFSDGPAGAAIFDFVMVAVDGLLWIHGGETNNGETRATLWSVQVFSDQDQSINDQFMYARGLEPLWSVRGFGGMAARKRHCAAAIGDVIYFWGGMAGLHLYALISVVFVCVCVCVCRKLSMP